MSAMNPEVTNINTTPSLAHSPYLLQFYNRLCLTFFLFILAIAAAYKTSSQDNLENRQSIFVALKKLSWRESSVTEYSLTFAFALPGDGDKLRGEDEPGYTRGLPARGGHGWRRHYCHHQRQHFLWSASCT